MQPDKCQLHRVPSLAEPLGAGEKRRQFLQHRLKRMVKRRVNYLGNVIRRFGTMSESTDRPNETRDGFRPGERVRIKSKDAIQRSLDNWNEFKGCGFMEEMWPYCGTEQKIFKRVRRFLDERDYRVKQVRGVYLLQGLICNGTVDFGPCDRSCFFFWQEDWLEKVNEG